MGGGGGPSMMHHAHGVAQGSGIDAVVIVAIVIAVLALIGIAVFLQIRTRALDPWLHRGTDKLLVSDQARDHAVSRLARAYAKGRLTRDELEERTQHALTARTRADLRAVIHDVPRARPIRDNG
jgi:hypothetical protein